MSLTTKLMECNGLCRDCYENRIRSVRGKRKYNLDAMIEAIKREARNQNSTGQPCLHGGEPLLMPISDLEQLLSVIYEEYGSSSIQTNGTLISDKHIELFKKYNVSVGVSLDGDTAELNWGRWNAIDMPKEKIQEMTDKVIENIRKCRDAGISVSMISILRRCNASPERLPDFVRFLFRMKDEFGINWVRTNEGIVYEEEYKRDELTVEELGRAFCFLADICFSDPELEWRPYRDVADALFGYTGNLTCVFTECDIYATQSERTVLYDGSLGCCLKGGPAIDGIQALRSEPSRLGHRGRERYVILEQIPQDEGGCKDCRFWHMCKGGCPGEGIDNDWRNKTRFCEAWKKMFSHIEKRIKGMMPNIYLLPDFYPDCPTPEMILSSLSPQRDGSLYLRSKKKKLETLKEGIKERVCQNSHGDSHGDSPHGDAHGDAPHGDRPHGDSGHGDSGHGDRPHGDRPHGDQ